MTKPDIEAIVAQDSSVMKRVFNLPVKSHKHITYEQAVWYVGILDCCAREHISVEDLGFFKRRKADKIHDMRSTCAECHSTYRQAVRGYPD